MTSRQCNKKRKANVLIRIIVGMLVCHRADQFTWAAFLAHPNTRLQSTVVRGSQVSWFSLHSIEPSLRLTTPSASRHCSSASNDHSSVSDNINTEPSKNATNILILQQQEGSPQSESAGSYRNNSIRVREQRRHQHQRSNRGTYDDLEARKQYIAQATRTLLESVPGSLTRGQHHQIISMIYAWSTLVKSEPEAPHQMEALLKRLVHERQAGNNVVHVDIQLYNTILDAWACAALFRTSASSSRRQQQQRRSYNPTTVGRNRDAGHYQSVVSRNKYDSYHQSNSCKPEAHDTARPIVVQPHVLASQRAREILVTLQETYEQSNDTTIQPNWKSFNVVLHCVCRTEGALVARRLLAWMEYLHKSGKNVYAKPSRADYLVVLDAYSDSGDDIYAGPLAEGFIRHMKVVGIVQPDTLCYNMAIKAWNKKSQRGRQAAEQVQRILEEMDVAPDLITYASVISAWAASGMRAHAITKVEELLRIMEDSPHLEVNTIVLNSVMSAWVKSKNVAAVNRTTEILQQMEDSVRQHIIASHDSLDTIPNTAPDLVSYNTHLHALSMHASPARPYLAQQALDILVQLEQGKTTMGDVPLCKLDGPNVFSYNLVIEAFCRARNPIGAANVLRRLAMREGVEPDTFSFNQVLSAISKSTIKGAAQMAMDLLEYMEKAYQSGIHPEAQPDVIGYTAVIVAYSRSGERGAADRAEALLRRMQDQYQAGNVQLKPSRLCYNALIDCWAKSGEGTLGARRAEALMREMEALYLAGDRVMAPNSETYNAVLNAWARSGTRCCGHKAETYLNRMWTLYRGGNKTVKPNDFSYNTVINAISKSKNVGKAQKALRVLRRMDQSYQAGNTAARPNEITYTAVINSCALPAVLDRRIRRKALDTAMFTLRELQSSRYGKPNQITYGTFMKACASLLNDDKDAEEQAMRRSILTKAFIQCCQDGQVGEMVLTYLRKAAPADLYTELLSQSTEKTTSTAIPEWSSSPLTSTGGMDHSRKTKQSRVGRTKAVVTLEDLPPEWRCNVREQQRKR